MKREHVCGYDRGKQTYRLKLQRNTHTVDERPAFVGWKIKTATWKEEGNEK